MSNISGIQFFLYILAIIFVLFLLGVIRGEKLKNKNFLIMENLEIPSISSPSEVSGGASELYGWGYTPIKKQHPKRKKKRRKCPTCENIYIEEEDVCFIDDTKDCRFADITKNIDIDKYVLKASVPSCPDMSQYIKKSEIGPQNFNPNEFIRKSNIPPCPQLPDMSEYIRKDQIPPCHYGKSCSVKAPECPLAPECPPCPGDKIVKVVEKIKYKPMGYMGKRNEHISSNWVPKLSELNEGFITEPMLAPMSVMRGNEVLKPLYSK